MGRLGIIVPHLVSHRSQQTPMTRPRAEHGFAYRARAVPADRRGRAGAGPRARRQRRRRRGLRRRRACRCRCARASSRTSSATATSRSASASTSASAAAMPARSDFSRRGAASRRCGRLRHRALHRRRPGRRPARRRGPGHAGRGRARPRPVPPLGHRRRSAPPSWRARCEDAALATDTPHHQLRRRRRVGAAVALLGRQHAAASAAAMPVRATTLSVSPIAGKGAGMQRDAWYSSMRDAARPGRARGRGPLRRRARAVAPEVAQACATCEVPVLFESTVAAGLLGAYVQATSGGALYRKASFLLDSLGQRGAARRTSTSTRTRTCRKRQGQRALRRRRRAHAARARWSRPAWCRATSCRATRRASSGMRTTGHAGGSQNLALTQPAHRSRATTSTRCCASWAAACSSPS